MDEKTCSLHRERIESNVKTNTNRLNNHSERIDKLEQFKSGTEIEMKNLIEQIKALVSTIKWMMTSTMVMLAGFLIWYIQKIGM